MAIDKTEGLGRSNLAVILARIVVPLWLFVGAILKLFDGSPSHLPAALIKWTGALDIDLLFMFRFSIVVELAVVAVMVFLPSLARWVGILMLGAFLPVLVGDVLMGASSCGCFGAVKVHPLITLVFDLGFFLGILVLGRREPRLAFSSSLPTKNVLLVGALSLLSVVLAFDWSGNGSTASGLEAGGAASGGLPESGFYLPQYESWIGQHFLDLDIASWSLGLPDDMNTGRQYVIFFRKDCEHCHELMDVFFNGPLEWPATAIAVPERDGFPTENIQPFSCEDCSVAELPSGVDWFLQTPVLVRLMDGVVECAAEEDSSEPECFAW